MQSATERAGKDAGPARYMMRSVACFQQQGVAFVDTQLSPAWQALHCNLAFSNVSAVTGPRSTACLICCLRLLHQSARCSLRKLMLCHLRTAAAICAGDWRHIRGCGGAPLLGAVPAALRAGR